MNKFLMTLGALSTFGTSVFAESQHFDSYDGDHACLVKGYEHTNPLLLRFSEVDGVINTIYFTSILSTIEIEGEDVYMDYTHAVGGTDFYARQGHSKIARNENDSYENWFYPYYELQVHGRDSTSMVIWTEGRGQIVSQVSFECGDGGIIKAENNQAKNDLRDRQRDQYVECDTGDKIGYKWQHSMTFNQSFAGAIFGKNIFEHVGGGLYIRGAPENDGYTYAIYNHESDRFSMYRLTNRDMNIIFDTQHIPVEPMYTMHCQVGDF